MKKIWQLVKKKLPRIFVSGWIRGKRYITPVLYGVVVFFEFSVPLNGEACRLLDPPAGLQQVWWVHVEGSCSSAERQNHVISGKDVVAALERGESLDFQGVLVTGDVMLDRISLRSVPDLSLLPASVQEDLAGRRLSQVRVIPGSLRITDSQFEQVLATNLSDGALIILGEVDLSGTTFLQSLDFSKTIFLQAAKFADMRIDYEGFFIGAQFKQPADFSRVRFGTHSRFHKAVFEAPVTFAEAQFQGVAEFLELVFQHDADFSRVGFQSGAGFSGSIFHGGAYFSGAEFSHEIYFRFSEFRDVAQFDRADFHKVVDFSSSHFAKPVNFSGATFSGPPEHVGSNLTLPSRSSRKWWQDPVVYLVIGASLLLFGGLRHWKRKEKG